MNATVRSLSTLVLCVAPLTISVGAATAADVTLGAAIEKAGLQRMLTQRISKAYCQIGLGVFPQRSRAQLRQAVELFDSQLAELEAIAPNREIERALLRVRELWEPFKAVAARPVSRDGAKQLAFQADDLLGAAHHVVQLLQDVSGTSHAWLVNVSGRQRMLSQRVAKLYMLQLYLFGTLTAREEMTIGVEMAKAKDEFGKALAALQAAPENSAAIAQRLDAVSDDWTWLRKALSMTDTDPFPITVAGVSESILVGMDEITRLYEELADKILTEPLPHLHTQSTAGEMGGSAQDSEK